MARPRTSSAPEQSVSSPWVGRDAEFALLRDMATTTPSLALVEGEAGVGKTRLVGEVLADREVAEQRHLVGHCPQMHDPFVLGPVVEALDTRELTRYAPRLSPVTGVLRPLLPEVADALPEQPPTSEDARLERHRIFRALREILGLLTPAVLVLEDVHWADEATVEFVEFLCGEPPGGLAIVLTYRREDVVAGSGLLGLASRTSSNVRSEFIPLAALTWQEVRALAAAFLATGEVSKEFAEQLHEWTAGIPLAVEETLRLLQDRQDLIQVEGGWARRELDNLEVPPAVRGAVLERADLLPADAGSLVEAAAVLGIPASGALLTEVAGLQSSEAQRALAQASCSALVTEANADQFALRHGLAIQAVYDAIPTPRRRQLHQRAADALEAAGGHPAGQLAHHYREADNNAQWARYAEAAGDEARSAADDRGAVEFYRQALSQAHTPDAKVRIAAKLGETALFGGHPRPAVPVLRGILEEYEAQLSPGVRGELRFSLALTLFHAGEADSWYELMRQAVDELEQARPAQAAVAMANLAMPRLMGGGLDENLEWLRRAHETAARQDDPTVTTGVLANRASVLLLVGDPRGWEAADDLPPRGASVEEELVLVHGYGQLAGSTLALGYQERSAAFLDAGEAILDELGADRWRWWLHAIRADLDLASGCWNALDERLEALAAETSSMPLLHTRTQLLQGLLLLAHGKVDAAEDRLEPSRRAASAAKDAHGMIQAATGLARIRLTAGDSGGASALAASALEAVRWKTLWAWAAELAPVAVEAHLAVGDYDAAAALTAEMATGLEGRDAPAAHAGLITAEARVAEACGRNKGAADAFARAACDWAALPRPLEAARARAAHGRALLATGDESGEAGLLEALETLSELEAGLDAAAVRRTLRAHGRTVPPQWRGGRKGYGDELSPREAEVARLSARGLTSQEIAERLFISRRTVEGHVRAALTKLGFSTKRELQRQEHALSVLDSVLDEG